MRGLPPRAAGWRILAKRPSFDVVRSFLFNSHHYHSPIKQASGFDCCTPPSQVTLAASHSLLAMPNPIVIHFVPKELISAFVIAYAIVGGAKSSLKWLFSGLPPSVRRRLSTPTLSAPPMSSPPVDWVPRPTVTMYKIQYIEPLSVGSDPYNYHPFSTTPTSFFDPWDTPSWASSSTRWSPMVAGDALFFYTVAMSLLMVRLQNLFPGSSLC